MKTYKVQCEFYIKAKSEEEAESVVADDMCGGDFMEEHIIIDEVDKLPEEHCYFNE